MDVDYDLLDQVAIAKGYVRVGNVRSLDGHDGDSGWVD